MWYYPKNLHHTILTNFKCFTFKPDFFIENESLHSMFLKDNLIYWHQTEQVTVDHHLSISLRLLSLLLSWTVSVLSYTVDFEDDHTLVDSKHFQSFETSRGYLLDIPRLLATVQWFVFIMWLQFINSDYLRIFCHDFKLWKNTRVWCQNYPYI